MRREEEPGGRERESSGVDIGERSPLFSSKVVECVSNKEVVTVSRHIVEVSQYRTFSIFFVLSPRLLDCAHQSIWWRESRC